jgi:glutaredoxin
MVSIQEIAMKPISVYWTPGCSSCVKVKEFLTEKGVDFNSVNVAADPAAMKFLLSLGVRTVPVVVSGQDYVFAQSLEDVARFVGLEHSAVRLPPETLVERWKLILDAAESAISRLPDEVLPMRPVQERARTVRDLAYHIYQVPDAFLQTVIDGLEDWTVVANIDAPSTISVDEIQAYGAKQRKRLDDWWDKLDDRSGTQPLKMFYGVHPLHNFLERSVWHSAQHTRQLYWWCEQLQIDLPPKFTPELTEGLPLPEGLWQ